MGYVCPVCEDPQADAEHLANHLAFTAMLGDDAHGSWLDEHAPGWGDLDPPALAERVTPHAEETEFPQVFEDTTDDADGQSEGHDHAHETQGRHQRAASSAVPVDVADVDDALDDEGAEDALAEARELTRQRRENAAEGENDGDENETDAADEGGDGADVDDTDGDGDDD